MEVLNIPDSIASSLGARILVVDEDSAARHNVVAFLSGHGMRASALAGREGLLHALSVREPDLVILRGSGDVHGWIDLLREVRAKSQVPLFVVGGENRDEFDAIIALELGADDYIIAPFSLRELLARVRCSLRRRRMNRLVPTRRAERCYEFENWVLDQRARQLRSSSGAPVTLSKGGFALLSAFVEAPRRTLSREHLLQATRVHENVFDRSIDVQVLRLREKIETDRHNPRLIRTVRGLGYSFDADVRISLTARVDFHPS